MCLGTFTTKVQFPRFLTWLPAQSTTRRLILLKPPQTYSHSETLDSCTDATTCFENIKPVYFKHFLKLNYAEAHDRFEYKYSETYLNGTSLAVEARSTLWVGDNPVAAKDSNKLAEEIIRVTLDRADSSELWYSIQLGHMDAITLSSVTHSNVRSLWTPVLSSFVECTLADLAKSQ